jgi:hypothetical protein
MALSPQYSWPEPDNSSLVKNGAQDIRALGDAIDTSVWNVGYGQAGKNKFINGNFGIWQRGTSYNVIDPSPLFGAADRWPAGRNGTSNTGTNTISRQAFTIGQTEVPNNPTYYLRWTVTTLATGQTRIDLGHFVEDVQTFAGQVVNVSFYGKASAARTYEIYLEQNFGSGGSTAVATLIGTGTITTGWTRLNVSGTLPSISGKTVGAGSYVRLILRVTGILAADVVEFANAQFEYGSKATNFQLAGGGDPQSELAMCQRYYFRYTSDLSFRILGTGQCFGTTTGAIAFKYPVTMRTRPTALEQTGTASNYAVLNSTGSATALSAVPTYDAATTTEFGWVGFTVASGLTAGNATVLLSNNLASVYLGWSAEL